MNDRYGYDVINGQRVPQLVVDGDYVLRGTHNGTVNVESGRFTLEGVLNGTLDIHSGANAIIVGSQNGSVSVASRSTVTVRGAINGPTSVSRGAEVIVEAGAKLAGTLQNDGTVIVRGGFGGTRSGGGELRLEGDGYIKQPTIRNGVHYYEW